MSSKAIILAAARGALSQHLGGADRAIAADAVTQAVTPLVEHATNNEPWYQSRVTWGALAAIALPLMGVFGVGADIITAEELTLWGMAAGSAFGGVVTLWGRWKAKRPIGS